MWALHFICQAAETCLEFQADCCAEQVCTNPWTGGTGIEVGAEMGKSQVLGLGAEVKGGARVMGGGGEQRWD